MTETFDDPHEQQPSMAELVAGCAAMAGDVEREAEALAWAEGLIADIID